MTLRSIVRVLGLLREASAQTSAAASSRPANKESTMTKVLVLYYSSHGHIEEMAYAAAEGIRSVGVEAIVKRVPETTPEEIAQKNGFKLDQQAPIATVDELAEYDGILLGFPKRVGTMPARLTAFLAQTGGILYERNPVGEAGYNLTG